MRASLAVQVLNVISGVELARGLGVNGRGELAAAVLWPTVIGAISTLGLEESMTYHVARERERAGRLLGSALVLCTLQALAFTAVTIALIPLVLQRHGGDTITAGLVYSGYVGVNVYALALTGTLNGLHRYGAYNATRLSASVVLVSTQTVLLAVGAFSVLVIATGYMIGYLACLLFGAELVRRAQPGRLQVDRATVRRVFAYGIRSNTSTTGSFVNQRLDQLVISIFLTTSQLGLYVVAITFTLFTPLIGASIALAALPNIARLDTTSERAVLARRLISLTFTSSLVISIPIIALAPQLIDLFFGSAFSAGADLTRVTAFASIAFATTRSLEAVLRGVGQPLTAGVAELAAVGTTVLGLATLLPTIGLIGAAWASLLAYSVSALWMAHRISVIVGLPIPQLLIPGRADIALVVARVRARSSSTPKAP